MLQFYRDISNTSEYTISIPQDMQLNSYVILLVMTYRNVHIAQLGNASNPNVNVRSMNSEDTMTATYDRTNWIVTLTFNSVRSGGIRALLMG